jgi:hypothetical protein
MNVRIEYNQKDGNFHFEDINKETKIAIGYKPICHNVNVDKAIEFIHHISIKFEAFNKETKPYPNVMTILSEFNHFIRNNKVGVAENLDRVSK